MVNKKEYLKIYSSGYLDKNFNNMRNILNRGIGIDDINYESNMLFRLRSLALEPGWYYIPKEVKEHITIAIKFLENNIKIT